MAGYEIYRDGMLIATSVASGFVDRGLLSAKTYQYHVAAYDDAGNGSAQSAGLQVTTWPASGGSDGRCFVSACGSILIALNFF